MEPMFQPLQPLQPIHTPPVEAEPVVKASGMRRAVITAVISGLLLVGGGVAAVSAASPAPSTSPGMTAPSSGGTSTTPRTHTGSSANCPNMGGSRGSSGTTPRTTPSTAPAQ